MKITLLVIGKTSEKYLKEGFDIYLKRLKKYISFEFIEISDLKGKYDLISQKRKEGEEILKHCEKFDYVILLDEGGKMNTSIEFSEAIQKKLNTGIKSCCFVIGGPYGFSEDVYQKCNEKVSLSKMTFSHQMVRLLFVEQLYRAFSILNNEPYHHV